MVDEVITDAEGHEEEVVVVEAIERRGTSAEGADAVVEDEA